MTAAKPPTACEGWANVLAALSFIPKQRSQGVSYEFRSIDAVMNVLHDHLAANRLFLRPRVLDDWRVQMIAGSNNREQTQAVFRVAVDVVASDGTSVEVGVGMAQSHDYGDKAVYQAQQNCVKYVLIESLCIPTAEQDMDAREADAVPARGPQSRVKPPPAEQDSAPQPASDEAKGTIVELLGALPEGERKAANETLENSAGSLWLDTLTAEQASKTIGWLRRRHDSLREQVEA